MKKIISLVLCLVLFISSMLLASCGKKGDAEDTVDPNAIDAADLFGDDTLGTEADTDESEETVLPLDESQYPSGEVVLMSTADFGGDGKGETVSIEKVNDEGLILKVHDSADKLVLAEEFHISDTGKNTYYLYTGDNGQYLVCYTANMVDGIAHYECTVFNPLVSDGIKSQGSAGFNINPDNFSFDIDGLLVFRDEVNAIFEKCILLGGTASGEIVVGDGDMKAPLEEYSFADEYASEGDGVREKISAYAEHFRSEAAN